MKQVLAKSGGIIIENIPTPMVSANTILVRTARTLISTGTEMTAVGGPTESLPKKILKNPGLVFLGLKSIRERGLKKTVSIARGEFETGLALGYSAAGTVIEVGSEIDDIQIGDRVACAGAGLASHAEYINVPRNLLVRIPSEVSFSEAASVTLGAIAMQGVRQAEPNLGEIHAVSGLGLLGLLTVQMLRANGCRVIGIDPDSDRRMMAENFGAELTIAPGDEGLLSKLETSTNGHGVDTTIITAATKSNEPLQQAMQITRLKGKVVIVGAIGLELQRSPFYEKEIDLRISRSYGPGRYDPSYEVDGLDYPYPYVRWSENRNMVSYLSLIADKKIDFQKMITKEYPIDQAPAAYAELGATGKKPLAILLTYQSENQELDHQLRISTKTSLTNPVIRVGLVGVGGFASAMHIPNLRKLSDKYSIQAVCDINGLIAKNVAQQNGAHVATTDFQTVINDPNIDLVLISTRHNLHASMAIAALQAGKAVFVEKPMALNKSELQQLVEAIRQTGQSYFVGFNRRYSPISKAIAQAVTKRQNPLLVYYRMNAGYIPSSHWVHGPEGGGRIIGEGCHIFDLFAHWTGASPIDLQVVRVRPRTENILAEDNCTITIKYDDGSICTLLYTALGNPGVSKEYAEIYFDGNTIILDDYKSLRTFGTGPSVTETIQDKGHLNELKVMADTLLSKDTQWSISLESMIQTTELTFTAASKKSD